MTDSEVSAVAPWETPRILVVDDELAVRHTFVEMLAPHGYICQTAGNGQEAMEAMARTEFDLIVSDIRMPTMDGLELLSAVAERSSRTIAVIVTAYADMDLAVEATRRGAYEFLCKPVDQRQLNLAVARSLEHRRLVFENRRLSRKVAHPPTFANLTGQSSVMLDVFRMVAQVARTNATILLTGESGTGKEQVARAIHRESSRHDKRFNVVNCGAIPEHLLESVLFGHRKGAFTGAASDHTGIIGYSDGGTVFFDEVGELPLHLQVKLLRVLQERTFQPLGAEEEVSVDIRIIAATNRNLKEAVTAGAFREDLYYRLNVIPIHLPPLRERGRDVEVLAQHFLDEFAEQFPDVEGFAPETLAALGRHSWPGNVRELRNAVERAVNLAKSSQILVEDLPGEVRDAPARLDTPTHGAIEDWSSYLLKVQHAYLSRLLALHDGNVRRAAALAGMSRKSLYKMLRDVDLEPEAFRRKR